MKTAKSSSDEPLNELTQDSPPIVDELIDGFWSVADSEPPEVEPSAEPAAAEPSAPVTQEEEDTEPPPQTAQETVERPRTYKYRGREYTLEQLVELGVLEDIITSAEQLPHLQKKYLERLEMEKAAAVTPPQETKPAEPVITPQLIRQHFEPIAKEVAKAGYMENDFVEAFPDTAASMLYHRDLLYDVRQAVAYLLSVVGGAIQANQRQAILAQLDADCNALAASGGVFQPLADPEVRKGFYDYLQQIDPRIDALNRDFLRRQWLAYNAEVVQNTLNEGAAAAAAAEAERRRLAGGEGGAAPKAKPMKSPEKSMVDELLEGIWPINQK